MPLLARAQTPMDDAPKDEFVISQKEKSVIAFFSLAGVAPDYQSWIEAGAAYRALETEDEQRKFVIKESLRLGRAYSSYNPDKDFLEFETTVLSHYGLNDGEKKGVFYFRFPEQTQDYIPVFEYPYGKDSIALIINRFADFSAYPLNEEQTEKTSKIMEYKDEEYLATLTLKIRPVKSVYDKPIVSTTGNQWMMLGEVAYIKCSVIDPTTLRKTDLWEYMSPWYKGNLAKEKQTDSIYPHPFDLFKEEEEKASDGTSSWFKSE